MHKLSPIENDDYPVAYLAQRRNKQFVILTIRGDEQNEMLRPAGENGGNALQQVQCLDRFVEVISRSQQTSLPIIIDNRGPAMTAKATADKVETAAALALL